MVVLPERPQTFWVCDRATDDFGHFSRANDRFHQSFGLFSINGHGDIGHVKHKSRDVLAAEPLSNRCLQLERELAVKRLTWLHNHEQEY